MVDSSGPGYRTGKLCYIEIPAADVAASAEFYQRAFGWKIRRRGAGAVAFDDTAGEVTWFRDPAGNVLGVYQQPGLAEAEAPAPGRSMAEPGRPVPGHRPTVTPRLVFRDARAAIEFYRDAFGAELRGEPFAGPGGMVVHAEIRIGNSVVYLTEQGDNGGEAIAPASAAAG